MLSYHMFHICKLHHCLKFINWIYLPSYFAILPVLNLSLESQIILNLLSFSEETMDITAEPISTSTINQMNKYILISPFYQQILTSNNQYWLSNESIPTNIAFLSANNDQCQPVLTFRRANIYHYHLFIINKYWPVTTSANN